MSGIDILMADDHTLLREALCEILMTEQDFRIVGTARDGEEAVSVAAKVRPDVVVMDVEMPRTQPHVTVGRLLRSSPGCKIVILSMHDDPHLVRDLLQAGVSAYLHKSVSMHDLASAIRSARRDDLRVTLSVSRGAAVQPPEPADSILSPREREIVGLVAQALSNRQIASQLSITEGTVKRHLRNIFGKLQAVSRIDAVNKATAGVPDGRPTRPQLDRRSAGYVPVAERGRISSLCEFGPMRSCPLQ
jgi:two-component system, NarL family, nitrate/nitrite response regulator NarL